MFRSNDKKLQILTPDGYKSFRGIQKVRKNSCRIHFECGKVFECSLKHPLCVNLFKFKFKKAAWLKKGDKIFGHDGWFTVESIEKIGKRDLFDIIGVDDTVCYYTDGLLSHNCEFINSGTSSMNEALYKELKLLVKEPIETLMNNRYKVYELPDPDRIYVAGVDTSDGVGGDYSCIKVLDVTDLTEIREVAEFYDNFTPVTEFTNIVWEVMGHWGYPVLCVERNNQGGQVADRLNVDYGYEKLVSWGGKLAGRKSQQLVGMISSRNTKYKACSNARYFYSDRGVVVFSSEGGLDELFKDFVKVNDTWQAVSGKHDDRSMALIWALMALDKEVCEEYFHIEEEDECGKPLKIVPNETIFSREKKFVSIYTNEEIDRIENSGLSPVVFTNGSGSGENEILELMADGWYFPTGSPYFDPKQDMDADLWNSIQKYC